MSEMTTPLAYGTEGSFKSRGSEHQNQIQSIVADSIRDSKILKDELPLGEPKVVKK